MPLKDQVEQVLTTIPDPELGISLMDLGLIYEVSIQEKGKVHILMTLTTIGCPLFSLIETPIKQEVAKIPGVDVVEVELTFEPAWTIDRLSEEGKAQLGMI